MHDLCTEHRSYTVSTMLCHVSTVCVDLLLSTTDLFSKLYCRRDAIVWRRVDCSDKLEERHEWSLAIRWERIADWCIWVWAHDRYEAV